MIELMVNDNIDFLCEKNKSKMLHSTKKVIKLGVCFYVLLGLAYGYAEGDETLSKNVQAEPKDRKSAIELALNTFSKEKKSTASAPPVNATQQTAPNSWSWLGLKEKSLGFHGYVETRHYYDLKRNNNREFFYEIRNNFRLEKELNFMEKLHGVASIDGSVFYFKNGIDGFENEEKRLDLWEGYLDYYGNKFDIRIGQQIIRWGKSDEVNPTDVFTPEDLSEFFNNVERAKRKIPVLASKFEYYLDPYSFEAIWLPFFKKTRLDESGGDWEPYLMRYYHSLNLPFLDDDGPARKLRNSSMATRIKREGENVDISLSYSYHFSETPALELQPYMLEIVPGLLMPTARVNPVYKRQHTIGGDFETVIGKFGIRGEGAFTTKTPFVSYDPAVISTIEYKDTLNYVLGADYTLPNGLYANLQYTQQYIFDSPGNLTTQEVEDSVVWRISQNFRHDTITLKTTGRYYLSTKDAVVECSLLYKITDALSLTTGFYLYYGESSGNLFGQYTENDQAFARLKYSF